MSDPTPPTWFGWIFGGGAGGWILTWLGRKVFSNAVREEIKEVLDGPHKENVERFEKLENKFETVEREMGEMKEFLAWIKGRMQKQWGDQR